MTSLADILETIFTAGPCDFCSDIAGDRAVKLCYTDTETGCRYCLPCLVLSTEEWPELPPDPQVMQMGREIVALPR